MSFFVTGTDTNAGKTYVSALLIRALRKRGVDCVGMKPLCCGPREDAETLHGASDGAAPLNEINPVWLRTPAAPYVAAMIENRSIDLDLIRQSYAALRQAHQSVIVEGVGGWLVPISHGYCVSDLAQEMGLPVVVVTANRLGALNHAALTVRSIRQQGLACLGIILNEVRPSAEAEESIATTTNRAVLETFLETTVLLEIGFRQTEVDLNASSARVLVTRTQVE